MLTQILDVRIYLHIQVKLLILKICNFEFSLNFLLSFHLNSLHHVQSAFLASLLGLVLVDTLDHHFNALGDVDLHRVDRKFEAKFVF